jgi:hypothetical protein
MRPSPQSLLSITGAASKSETAPAFFSREANGQVTCLAGKGFKAPEVLQTQRDRVVSN